MGLYRRFLAPRVVDTICSPRALGKWRARVVEDLSGQIIEIGFGAGRNLEYYPGDVTAITAIEPSSVMRKRAEGRIKSSGRQVTFGGLDGQKLDLPDASFDAAVVTFSLCTIPDPALALRELRRVVRPGGELRVLEHGLSPDATVATWQRRLDGFEQFIADGCHLTRDVAALVATSGWSITESYSRYAPGPKPWTYFTSLRAR
jgi:ubiquinone/menaquinone biosynthesis C-methylase UbiE